MNRCILGVRLAALFLLLALVTPAQAQILPKLKEMKKHKDDVVVLDNGDRLTGEIKKVQHGILYFKTDRALGTLELDWERIRRLTSSARYEFEDNNGKRYVGLIAQPQYPPVADGRILLNLDDGSAVEMKLAEILEIREMQQNILGRLNLSLDAGVTYTHGNKQTQTTVQTNLEYSQPRYSLSLSVDSLFSGQSNGSNTSRHEVVFFGNRHLSRMWSSIALAGVLHDNQQDLDLRSTLGGGLRRTFVKTNRTLFAGYGGFVYTRENYIPEEDPDRNNGEILAGLSLSSYEFRSSELNAYINVFPSVTDPGRIRIDVSSDWKWEIVKDLYWKLSVFDNFDSRPPSDTIQNNFGVTSSVGWSF